MKRISYIVATAGHVDHGKSSLVRALTGSDPDRLPEEKARGMTIDLGFAHLVLRAPPPVLPPVEYDVGIVDVPGHEDFVRNMVAGVGSVDLALLVVAADDGWMPQTEEHLHILTYLGISCGIVAVTKVDLPHDAAALRAQVQEKLHGTPLEGAPIIGVSAPTGQGMDGLKSELARLLSVTPPREDLGLPRLPVDRVFTLKGIGTIATGTLCGGTLNRGQTIVVQSHGRMLPGRIRTLQTHHRNVAQAAPGSRVAVNLPDLYPAEACHDPHKAIRRGDVITVVGIGRASITMDVQVWRLDRQAVPPAIPNLCSVQVHLGSCCMPGRLVLLQASELRPGGQMLAQLRLEHPLLAFAGDRVVIRDSSGRHTLAGAMVLDPLATRYHTRKASRLERLAIRAACPRDAQAWIRAELRGRSFIPRDCPLEQSHFGRPAQMKAADGLIHSSEAIAAGEYLTTEASWKPLLQQAMDAVDAWHRRHPEQPGMPVADLRTSLGDKLPNGVHQAVIVAVCADGFVHHGAVIRRITHLPTLPPELQQAGDRLRAQLSRAGLDPPSSRQLAPDPVSQQALHFLVINGDAVEVGPDNVIGAEAMAHARRAVRQYIQQHGPSTVAQLKTALGSNRRIMVPLLERLDREGVTLRQGDLRVLH